MRRMISSIGTQMAINAQTVGVTAATGTGIDRRGYESCILTGFIGSISGASSYTVTFKLQESSDDSTYSDITDATVAITYTNTRKNITQDLNGIKRYVRAVATPGVDAGYVLCGAVLILGEPRTVPVT